MSFFDGDPLSLLPRPPCDPEAARTQATRYSNAATGLSESARLIRAGATGTIGQTWIGLAAASTGVACESYAQAFDKGATFAGDAGTALRTCADDWDLALADWDRARRLADDALAEEARHAEEDGSFGDHLLGGDIGGMLGDVGDAVGVGEWHSPLRQEAKTVALGAISDAQAAADICAQALNTAADTLGAPPIQHEEKHFWNSGPVGWVVDQASEFAATTVDVVEHLIDHPGDAGSLMADFGGMALGVGLIALGSGMEVGGFALDATGVGAVVGVPANVIGAGLIVSGGAIAGGAAVQAGRDFNDLILESRSQADREADPGYGGRPNTPPRETPPGARPYDQKLADEVPPWGANGDKTDGLLEVGGTTRPLTSGADGPSRLLPGPPRTGTGMNGNNITHVEAHAAAQMRLSGSSEATLYINRIPCGGSNGCERWLYRMVPPGARLTIYGPNGYVRVVQGGVG